MERRLVRSRTDVVLGGVCAGLAHYLGIDPLVVRIFFVILTVADGVGFMIYLILWLLMPREDVAPGEISGEFSNRVGQVGQEFGDAVRRPHPHAPLYLGVGLIAAGIFFLLQNLHLAWLSWLTRDLIWPALLIIAGGILLWRAFRPGGG